jgi:hypothetical protein
MSSLVVIRTYGYRHEAELFRSVLDGHGIAATVMADDEGALHPGLGFARGVHLAVAADAAERASDILDAHEDDRDDADGDGETTDTTTDETED